MYKDFKQCVVYILLYTVYSYFELSESLIMLLKYPIIDSEVLNSVNFLGYLLAIIRT